MLEVEAVAGGEGEHLRSMGLEEGAFDARRVVLGQVGNAVEDLRACGVVEEPGWELLLLAAQTFAYGAGEGGFGYAYFKIGCCWHVFRGQKGWFWAESGQNEWRGSDRHVVFRVPHATGVENCLRI